MKYELIWQEARRGTVEADTYEAARDAWYLAAVEGSVFDHPAPQLLSINEVEDE